MNELVIPVSSNPLQSKIKVKESTDEEYYKLKQEYDDLEEKYEELQF